MFIQLIVVEKRSDFRWADPARVAVTDQDFIAEGVVAKPPLLILRRLS